MEIYLDANATTPVLPQARAAALATMSESFGNPSSIHSTGLRARAMLDSVRASARRVLEISSGELLFTSGATEGVQTAVLSALTRLRERRDAGEPGAKLTVLYGATEHKAVPEAIRHWNRLLGLGLDVLVIPVDSDGRHDLAWLRKHAPSAGLICTMAANNETGVVSDLDGIADVVRHSDALWLVDSVQALGKLSLDLQRRRIDYAPFSGHKLYAPKGIGMLYVRQDAPFTPLITGGGQEGALRSGTENMAGIAALGAVLKALEDGDVFQDRTTLAVHRERLASALRDAFDGLIFNVAEAVSLPTTLNFSVPGISSKALLDLFDAAGLRVSGGSACSSAKAMPSYVLEAMGLPEWQTAAAVRLSFGAADGADVIEEACSRIRSCGASLRASCLCAVPQANLPPPELVTRYVVDGACCYLIADSVSRQCVVIDPLPELTDQLAQWVRCRSFTLAAVLDTHSHGDHVSSAGDLRAAVPALLQVAGPLDALGWPTGAARISFGSFQLSRLALPGHTVDSTAYLLHEASELRMAFVGDTVLPGALGRSDFEQSEPLAYTSSLKRLESAVGPHTLLLPGHDYENRFACTLNTECAAQPLLAGALRGDLDAAEFAIAKAELERSLPLTEYQTMACGARVDACSKEEQVAIDPRELVDLKRGNVRPVIVDVREPYEHRLSAGSMPNEGASSEAVALSNLASGLPRWLKLPSEVPVVFFCRSGNRSAEAARALRRLGHDRAWSLEGGLALWPGDASDVTVDTVSAATL